jgi:hypothetical protein
MLIEMSSSKFDHVAFLTYEQIRPHDAFGAIMMSNLEVPEVFYWMTE